MMESDSPHDAFEAVGISGGWGFDHWTLPALGMLLLILRLFALGLYAAWREEKGGKGRTNK